MSTYSRKFFAYILFLYIIYTTDDILYFYLSSTTSYIYLHNLLILFLKHNLPDDVFETRSKWRTSLNFR